MKSAFLLLAVLFVFLPSTIVAHRDIFRFDVTFSCLLTDRATWQFNFSVYEIDIYSPNDLIGSWNASGLIGPKMTSFVLDTTDTGDELGSEGYRPMLKIYHDCTSDKSTVILTLISQMTCDVGVHFPAICNMRIVKDVTNQSRLQHIMPALKHDLTPFE